MVPLVVRSNPDGTGIGPWFGDHHYSAGGGATDVVTEKRCISYDIDFALGFKICHFHKNKFQYVTTIYMWYNLDAKFVSW